MDFKKNINRIVTFLRKHWFIIFIVVLSILKQIITLNIPLYANGTDLSFVKLAENIINGNWLGEYTVDTLTNGIGFSLFLAIINCVGISYMSALTLLYSFSCLIFICSIKDLFKTKKSKIYLSILYTALLFNPVSFSVNTFQRVHYNALIVSQILIIFGGFIALILRRDEEIKKILPWSILTGVGLLCFWNTAQNNVWIIPFIIIIAFILIGKEVFKKIKSKESLNYNKIIVFAIPIILLIISNIIISFINYTYYGTYTTNELNDSSFTDAIKAIYSVKSEDNIEYVSVSREQLKEMYEISPTLASVSDILEMKIDEWSYVLSNDSENKEIRDEWFYIVLRNSVSDSGYYENAQKANLFYKQIADEINDAIKKGQVETQTIMPSILMSPWHAENEYFIQLIEKYTQSEIYITEYKELVAAAIESETNFNDTERFVSITNNLPKVSEDQQEYLNNQEKSVSRLNNIISIYKTIGAILFKVGVISYIYITIRMIIGLKEKNKYIISKWLVLTLILLSMSIMKLIVAYNEITAEIYISYFNISGIYSLIICFEFISIFTIINLFIDVKNNEQSLTKIEMKIKSIIKKIYFIIKNIFIENYVYIIGVFLLCFKEILLFTTINIDWRSIPFFRLIGLPMLILSPCINKNGKKSVIYANVIYFIITVIIYADMLYYSYALNFISIFQLGNLKYAEEIGSGLKNLITFQNILGFFVDNILIIIASIIILKKKPKEEIIERKNKYFKYIFCIILLIANVYKINTSLQKGYNRYIYNKTTMVSEITIYYYHVLDIKDYIMENFTKEKVDYEYLEELYNENMESKEVQVQYEGIAEGSNVIILQLESFYSFLINNTINGQEITPNLNKFFADSVYCTDMYNQGTGSTADSEHTIATSMYPLENGRVYEKYFKNKYDDIYSTLKENGYYISAMHANINTFWNRHIMYLENYSVDEYNDDTKFNSYGETAGGWFPDEHFFTQAVDMMSKYEEPFCSMLISVSSHVAFSLEGIEDLDQKLTIDTSNIESETLSAYLLSCNYVDYSFGKFMEKLEETDLINNSIIVVYGDHGAGLTDADAIAGLYEENEIEYTLSMSKFENVHIPFGMRIPNVERNIITDAVSKIDVKPTILSLLGIGDEFSLGQSIFSGKDYSFIKGIGFVNSDTYYVSDEYIDRKTDEVIEETEELETLKNKMNNELTLSDTIIKNNLLVNEVK